MFKNIQCVYVCKWQRKLRNVMANIYAPFYYRHQPSRKFILECLIFTLCFTLGSVMTFNNCLNCLRNDVCFFCACQWLTFVKNMLSWLLSFIKKLVSGLNVMKVLNVRHVIVEIQLMNCQIQSREKKSTKTSSSN